MEGLQGCWMPEVQLCSRGRSGPGELEALHVGLRMCTICVSMAPKVGEKKRESREQNFAYGVNSSFSSV